MTRKIRAILKRSGEWGIKWNSLQLRLLWYFVFSIIVAFIAFQATAFAFSSWFESRSFEEWKNYREISEVTANDLVSGLKGLNPDSAAEYLEVHDPEYRSSIELIDADGLLIYHKLHDFGFFNDTNRGYAMPYITLPAELANGTGLLVYQSVPFESKLFFTSDYILGLIAVLAFGIVFLLQSRKIIKDINYMDSCVAHITRGNLDIRIRQFGNDEFGHLGENIDIMRKSIKRMLEEREKDEQRNLQLISGISHDLKTPLTSLIGYLNILKNPETITTSAEDQKVYIERCHSQAQRLRKLIADLFTYVKYTDSSLKLSKTVFQFQDLLEQVLEEHSAKISESGIELKTRITVTESSVYGDPDHIARVINNLFDNLTLYTDGEKDAELTLFNQDRNIVLELSNTAASLEGIDPEMLFERMVRGDESRSSSDGSGLGLSICREIVRLHSGRISAEISGGKFTIRLMLPCV